MTKLKRNKKKQQQIKDLYTLLAVTVFGIWAVAFQFVVFTGA